MRPSLKNPGLKIERAKEHLDILSTEIVRFRKNNPFRVVDYEDSKNGLYIRQIEAPIIDPKLAIIAGDAVYSLRSALDHVAWQLALLTKAKPYSNTCFPIIDEDTADKLRRFKTATKDIPYEAVEHIKDFQPYNKRQSYKTDFLWMLDKLCNIDKHRVIPAEGTAVDFKVPKNVDLSFGTFNKKPAVFMPISVKAQMKLAPPPVSDIIFGSNIDGLAVSIKELYNIYRYVKEGVIPRFISFFSD